MSNTQISTGKFIEHNGRLYDRTQFAKTAGGKLVTIPEKHRSNLEAMDAFVRMKNRDFPQPIWSKDERRNHAQAKNGGKGKNGKPPKKVTAKMLLEWLTAAGYVKQSQQAGSNVTFSNGSKTVSIPGWLMNLGETQTVNNRELVTRVWRAR